MNKLSLYFERLRYLEERSCTGEPRSCRHPDIVRKCIEEIGIIANNVPFRFWIDVKVAEMERVLNEHHGS